MYLQYKQDMAGGTVDHLLLQPGRPLRPRTFLPTRSHTNCKSILHSRCSCAPRPSEIWNFIRYPRYTTDATIAECTFVPLQRRSCVSSLSRTVCLVAGRVLNGDILAPPIGHRCSLAHVVSTADRQFELAHISASSYECRTITLSDRYTQSIVSKSTISFHLSRYHLHYIITPKINTGTFTMAWPHNTRAAISLTFDNMGEAADLNRGLWPHDQPIGHHYSVTEVLPKFLSLARKYSIPITYFCESFNLDIYPDAIKSIADEGHEVAWHAWQHEAWNVECKDPEAERENFEKSFGAVKQYLGPGGKGEGGKVETYRGFRPPGGVVHGERTFKMCRDYGLGYISPAAHEGALVPIEGGRDSIVVLPFRWSTVDAYYYMDAFSKLREMKGELPSAAQGPDVLVEWFTRQVSEAIEKGGFLSLLFHPFLNNAEERLEAMETVMKHLVKRRDEGKIWLARCRDVEEWVRGHAGVLGDDPIWDNSSWR